MSRAFEHLMNFLFVTVGHRGNDRVFVFEIAVNQADADSGFGADIVHAGLMKAALGKACHSGLHDLLAAILSGI